MSNASFANPLYSIVVPAFNESEFLPSTLAALRHAMNGIDAGGELIVVDNNSTDTTAAVARANGADQVVFEPVNQISRARNKGAEAARGELLIFVDADTVVSPALLKLTVDTLAHSKTCGGGTRVSSSEPMSWLVRLLTWQWNLLARAAGWAAGSYVFCRKEAWAEVGGFNEDVFASEEIHFSRAIRAWGNRKGERFRILSVAVDTSMRKFKWYSKRQLLVYGLKILICPRGLRDRSQCDFWYKRPSSPADSNQGNK